MLRILNNGGSSDLDDAIDRILVELNEEDLDSEGYAKKLSYLERMIKLRTEDKSRRISPDTMAIIGGNLLGILIIVGYERVHVIGSKSLAFVLRTKYQ